MLKSVLFLPFHYRGVECLGISCSLDPLLEGEIRKLKGIKWSGTHRCWYLPFSRASYGRIKEHLYGKVVFHLTQLKAYLEQRKVVGALMKTDKITRKRALLIAKAPLVKRTS